MSFKIMKLRIEVFVQALFVGISKVNKRYFNGGGHMKNPAMDVRGRFLGSRRNVHCLTIGPWERELVLG